MGLMIRPMCMLTILALLSMSIDGAIDIAQFGHPHEDPLSHQTGDSHHFDDVARDEQSGGDSSSSDHCEHCCHGHTSVLTAGAPGPVGNSVVGRRIAYAQSAVANFAQAPPTPPPNA